MGDDSEHGAASGDDAAAADVPLVDEELATLDAGGEVVADDDGHLDIEGPNSA